MIETLIQTAGWIGTILILLAYFLVSNNKVHSNSKSYQLMNLLGALGVGLNVFHQKAWPAVALQTIWGVIALVALTKLSSKNS